MSRGRFASSALRSTSADKRVSLLETDDLTQGMHAGIRAPAGHRPNRFARHLPQRGLQFRLNRAAVVLHLPAHVGRAIVRQSQSKGTHTAQAVKSDGERQLI